MDDFGLLTLITIISAATGFIIAGLLVSLRGEKDRPPAARAGRSEEPPASGLEEVARLWQDTRQGRLVVELGGKLVRFAGEARPGELDRLVQIHAALGTLIGTPAPANPGIRPPDNWPAEDRRLDTAPPAQAGRAAVEMLAQPTTAEANKPAAQRSMVAQIDEILQEKLAQGRLAQRAVRLMELPGKGMVVLVGLEQYAGVEEIPDPEIRHLIRQCVAEWETRPEGK